VTIESQSVSQTLRTTDAEPSGIPNIYLVLLVPAAAKPLRPRAALSSLALLTVTLLPIASIQRRVAQRTRPVRGSRRGLKESVALTSRTGVTRLAFRTASGPTRLIHSSQQSACCPVTHAIAVLKTSSTAMSPRPKPTVTRCLGSYFTWNTSRGAGWLDLGFLNLVNAPLGFYFRDPAAITGLPDAAHLTVNSFVVYSP
jgi:hypothetical protein